MRIPDRPLGLEMMELDLRRQERIEQRVSLVASVLLAIIGTALSLYFIRWWVSA